MKKNNMEKGLRQDVGLFSAILYGVGIILGAGIYALIGEAAGIAGNALWLSFLISALVSSFTGMSYMELVSMFQVAAAEYVYVKNAFKNDLLAFIVGWFTFSVSIIAASAVSLGFASYFHALFNMPIIPAAIGLIAIMSFISFWGIVESTKINVIFTLIEVIGLVFIVGIAFFSGSIGSVNYLEMPTGLTGVFSAAALIFFAYIGFEDLANITEEVKDAKRNVPIALITSVIITSVIYILVSISVVSLADWKELGSSSAPLALAASTVMGNQAFWAMSIIALFATANTVLICLIVGSRAIYGMSSDGSLPKAFSKIHEARGTPWIATLTVMLFSILFAAIGNIKTVASITDFGVFFIFIFVNLSAIVLRYRLPNAEREFKTPLNIGKFPLIPFFGLLSALFLVMHLTLESLIVSAALIIISIIVYIILKRKIKI
jgi:APA family basic amino acid/polyamine antiporter